MFHRTFFKKSKCAKYIPNTFLCWILIFLIRNDLVTLILLIFEELQVQKILNEP